MQNNGYNLRSGATLAQSCARETPRTLSTQHNVNTENTSVFTSDTRYASAASRNASESGMEGLGAQSLLSLSDDRMDNSRVSNVHSRVIPLTVAGVTYLPSFEIVDIPDKIIIGMSIMKDLQGIVDINSNNVTLGGVKIPFIILDGKPKITETYD